MEIYGHERGFRYTVGAEREIARLCPDEDIGRLGEALRGRTPEAVDRAEELVCILSRWHEKARGYEEDGYQERPLTRETIDTLPPATFRALLREALDALLRDRRASVETEPEKKGAAPK